MQRLQRGLGGLFFLLGGVAFPASAQERESQVPDQRDAEVVAEDERRAEARREAAVDEFLVTAQRRAENLQDVPLAISAMRGSDLAERGVGDITDLQHLVPNVNIQQRASAGVITIRGVGFDIVTAGAESGVAMHLDGVFVARPAAGLAGFYDVERVEVVRGPQGTLYGRNSTGGAVNLITRKPTATPEGYVIIGAGSYEQMSIESAVGGPLSDRVRWRFSSKMEDRNGYGINEFNGRDIDDLNSRAARMQFAFDLSETAELNLSADYYAQRDSAYGFHYAGPVTACRPPGTPGVVSPPEDAYLPTCGILAGGSVPSDIRNLNHDFHPINDREFYGVAATLDWDLGPVQLRSISAYRGGASHFASDLDATSANLFYVTRDEDQSQRSQELQLLGGNEALEWVAGVYYFHEANDAGASGDFGPDTGRSGFFQGGHLRSEAYAAFGQSTWRATHDVSLTLGARYSWERKSIEDEQSFPGVGAPILRPDTMPDEATFRSFTPRVGIEWRPRDGAMLFASYQRGFKSGGFSLGSLVEPYRPEQITSYELGIKTTPWSGARFNATVFHYDYSDLHQSLVEGFASVIRNAASAKIDGVELEFATDFGRGYAMNLNAAWLDARFDEYTTADPARIALGPQDLSGHSLSNAPDYTANLGVQRSWYAFNGELTLRADVYASGKVYFSGFNLNTDSQSDYRIANLTLSYQGPDGWFGSTFVRNITDETVSSGGVVNSALVGAISTRSLLPPRVFGVRIGRHF